MTVETLAASLGRGGMRDANAIADFHPEPVGLAPQVSANLIRNANRGTLSAEAEVVQRGRTARVVEVPVLDDARRLIAKPVAVLPMPTAITAAAPVEPTGR